MCPTPGTVGWEARRIVVLCCTDFVVAGFSSTSTSIGSAQRVFVLVHVQYSKVVPGTWSASLVPEKTPRQGHANAQCGLGALYVQGQGVEQSIEKARALWLKAAEQGEELAIKSLQQLDEIEGRLTPSFIPKPFECATCYRPHDPSENKPATMECKAALVATSGYGFSSAMAVACSR